MYYWYVIHCEMVSSNITNILWDIKFQAVKHLPADQSDIAVVDKEQKRADRCDNPCWQQHLKRAQEAEDIPRTEWTTGKEMEGEVQSSPMGKRYRRGCDTPPPNW